MMLDLHDIIATSIKRPLQNWNPQEYEQWLEENEL
jgi:hypothetical protein